jgi:hypothetical protein
MVDQNNPFARRFTGRQQERMIPAGVDPAIVPEANPPLPSSRAIRDSEPGLNFDNLVP